MRRGAFDFYVAILGSAEKASEAKNTMEFSRLVGGKNYASARPEFFEKSCSIPRGCYFALSGQPYLCDSEISSALRCFISVNSSKNVSSKSDLYVTS